MNTTLKPKALTVGSVRISVNDFDRCRAATKLVGHYPKGLVLMKTDHPIEEILPEEIIADLKSVDDFTTFLKGRTLLTSIRRVNSTRNYNVWGYVIPYLAEREPETLAKEIELWIPGKFHFRASTDGRGPTLLSLSFDQAAEVLAV